MGISFDVQKDWFLEKDVEEWKHHQSFDGLKADLRIAIPMKRKQEVKSELEDAETSAEASEAPVSKKSRPDEESEQEHETHNGFLDQEEEDAYRSFVDML